MGRTFGVEGAAKNATQLSGIHYTTVGSTTSTIITAVDGTGGTNIVNGFNFGSGLQLVSLSQQQLHLPVVPSSEVSRPSAATWVQAWATTPRVSHATTQPRFLAMTQRIHLLPGKSRMASGSRMPIPSCC